MSVQEKVCVGTWAANLAVICATNVNEIGHCLAVLLLYGAVYFLFAPLHALIAVGVWTTYAYDRSVRRAADRLLCVESLAFWGIYWAMVFEIIPLYFRAAH